MLFLLTSPPLVKNWKEALALIVKLFGLVFLDVDVEGCIVFDFPSDIVRLEVF